MKAIMNLDSVWLINNNLDLLGPMSLRRAKERIKHVSLSQIVAFAGTRNLPIDDGGGLTRPVIGTFTRRTGNSTTLGVSIPCRTILRGVSTGAPRNVLFFIWHGGEPLLSMSHGHLTCNLWYQLSLSMCAGTRGGTCA